jgi:5'-phosphate synthase pdxT subunit
MRIGVLALQGDFEKHAALLTNLGVDHFYVRNAAQLARADALILPGGESTTILRLLDVESLFDPLVEFARTRPVMGTCAGCILIASEVLSPAQRCMGLLDITVERNAYGRQVDSSIRTLAPSIDFARRSGGGELEAVFIRAPIIRQVGKSARVLLADGPNPVLVEQGLHLALTFHPELSGDTRVHRLLAEKVQDSLMAPVAAAMKAS